MRRYATTFTLAIGTAAMLVSCTLQSHLSATPGVTPGVPALTRVNRPPRDVEAWQTAVPDR